MSDSVRDASSTKPHFFTVPPGAPFLPTFVDALLEGGLVAGFSRAAGPLRFADATIYVPTRRSARALAAAFAEGIGASGTFLPRILPLGDTDALETGSLLDESRFDLEAVETAIDPLARRMVLTKLILGWGQSVRHAMLPVDAQGSGKGEPGEALLVASTPVDAWHLSGELAGLLDEMILAGLEWRALKPLGTEAFDRYWGITLEFLKIATGHWPAILAERGLIDPASRQKRLIEAEIARLNRPEAGGGPVIVAGTIGADPLTARLIGAVARHPQGAVVLPGLDQALDETSWDLIGSSEAGFGHPQGGLHRMLAAIGATRAEVVPFGSVDPDLKARGRFVSEALRPAETTDAWHAIAKGAEPLDIPTALARMGVVEATDEAEEALALAIALRETLEGTGSAVLVTPDHTLARRVREELVRWGIEIDDSGGEPLATTAAGALARLALEAVTSDLEPVAVLALLAHPAVRLGRPREAIERLSRVAELCLLRGVVPAGALSDPGRLIAAAQSRAADEHAPSALRRLKEADFAELEALLVALLAALAPLRDLAAATSLPAWVAAHEDALAALVRTETDESALAGPDAAKLASLIDDLTLSAEPTITLDRVSYAALFGRIAAETTVRGPARSHPRLKILGLLEMRLLDADRVLLGGLDEAIWPPQVKTDAFLNRPMRTALGLAPPERRIGQAAHDFEMLLGHPEVLISRAAKRGGAPTVPSRFLQRMAAVAGAGWSQCQERGRVYLDFARALDRPARPLTIRRPAPKPPVVLRPTQLSVTRVELLRRDPYAIYAERILGLRPLDPIGAAVGPREWGTAFHGVLRTFVERVRHAPLPPDAVTGLLQEAQAAFADLLVEPHAQAFLGPRVERWVHGFHGWHSDRHADLAAIHVEEKGSLVIPLDDGTSFELTANADRLETDRAGALRIIDYKTGQAPTKKEVAAGFAPQLTLEAAIALGGGFAVLADVAALDEALYVKFGTGREPAITRLAWDDRTLREVVAEHLDGLRDLLNAFRDPDTGYVARPYPQFLARHSDYDHLSRVKEWSATGGQGDTAGETGE